MVCPHCGNRVKWSRYFFRIVEKHDIDQFCRFCGKVVTITAKDAERERQLKMYPRRQRDRMEGLCNICGARKAKEGLRSCEICLANRKVEKEPKEKDLYGISKKLYSYRRSYGLCVLCGEPARKSAAYCDKCKEKLREKKT